ncbi:hypothetical protein FHR24_001323 [Wenyingzhuangia heitensis]|uniref:3-keto-alpha-glucoside-1,2-lyase/3-keto-2-hydroxy-glucal hydratase domain-containing protein n=1 Tax=Wenyingzhuangia heitensis TaxID=1487859 RepID=A0ABX0U7Q9_9FLAO|nr:DUF1080 domain-containing protein [Wenyingzhuangia heitensis]NIJ44884.1 hypothetical protein [Wenyingzhuangia heitensis]
MKNKLLIYLFLSTIFATTHCFAQEEKLKKEELKHSTIELTNLKAFKKSSKNWMITKNVSINRKENKLILSKKGKGVLTNLKRSKKNQNLISKQEHGNIELEFDVMLSKGVQSGIYLQGRYKVLLNDSWSNTKNSIQNIGNIEQQKMITTQNMAKAPGLWQHVKIVFQAPKFDTDGNKIRNAHFEEIVVNNNLVLQNIAILKPSLGAIFTKEVAMGPLVIQATNKAIAFKNIRYKLNTFSSLQPENILSEVKKSPKEIENTASLLELKTIRKKNVKTISPLTDLKKNAKNLIVYSGTFNIPENAEYLFTMFVSGGGFMSIGNQEIFNFNMSSSGHENTIPSPQKTTIHLKQGKTPFVIAYNKNSTRNRAFELYAEGEHLQRYSLATYKTSKKEKEINDMHFIVLKHKPDRTVVQRSFLMHKDYKRTHCISVGHPQNTNYSYDLAVGSLLQIWNGGFVNATHMWYGRGAGQLAFPEGAIIPFHGDVDFAFLKNENSIWPTTIPEGIELEQKGYEFDEFKNPTFLREINGDKIANKFTPSTSERKLTREITTDSKNGVWHKITEADAIEILPDGTYLILNQNIFIDFSGNKNIQPIIRSKGKGKELIIKIPSGKQKVNYDIIW